MIVFFFNELEGLPTLQKFIKGENQLQSASPKGKVKKQRKRGRMRLKRTITTEFGSINQISESLDLALKDGQELDLLLEHIL